MKVFKNILMFLLIFLLAFIIFMLIPYSPMKNKFSNEVEELKVKSQHLSGDVFTEEDFADFPLAIQKYIEQAGFIGKKKMDFMTFYYDDVRFKQDKDRDLIIDYIQYNFVSPISRMAFIDTSIMKIPFEGFDSYKENIGIMKGVVGKIFTIFDYRDESISQGTLSTYLAESVFLPSVLLSDHIEFKEIDDYTVEGKLTYNNLEVRGTFHFNEFYEMTFFVADKRGNMDSDGNLEYHKWTAECRDYKVNEEGLKLPTNFKAIWNYPEGDFVYFDGEITKIEYGN